MVTALAHQAGPPVGPPEDLRLTQLAASGDPRARNMLAMRLCERIRRLMRGLLRNPQDADDAAQDALVEILGAVGSYRGEGALEHWADRIAIRVGLRFRRRQRRAPTTSALEPEQLHAPAPTAESAEVLPRALADYLDALPDKERRVLFLKHGLGYSVPEVATQVGVARSTTKYRLATALKRIRRAIRRDLALGVGESR